MSKVIVKKINDDRFSHQWVPGNDINQGGVFTMVSWNELEQWIRDAGRISDNESIDMIRVDETGIRVRLDHID